jgi:hypothetical protein
MTIASQGFGGSHTAGGTNFVGIYAQARESTSQKPNKTKATAKTQCSAVAPSTPSRNTTPCKNTGNARVFFNSNVKCNDRLKNLIAAVHHLQLAGESALAAQVGSLINLAAVTGLVRNKQR